MRVAVIGGGVFGCTIAADLAHAGAQVDLYEARSDVLGGSTARCQARLHRGYHYPRSDATAAAARDSFNEFKHRFPLAMKQAQGHYYAIAPGGKTSAVDYLLFCDRLGLPYSIATHPMIHNVDAVLRVPEAIIDVDVLRRMLRRELAAEGVAVHVSTQVDECDEFDWVIWATYGNPWPQPLRYEICELAIVEIGRYSGESIVVMDGDFISLDPWHGLYALYDVQHTVHHSNVGTEPEIPDGYAELLRRPGLLRSELTHVNAMLDSAGRFLRAVDPRGRGVAIYHGSMYSLRAVLPDVDATDERPTVIDVSGNQIRVLSGKMCTAPAAARSVVAQVFGLVPA